MQIITFKTLVSNGVCKIWTPYPFREFQLTSSPLHYPPGSILQTRSHLWRKKLQDCWKVAYRRKSLSLERICGGGKRETKMETLYRLLTNNQPVYRRGCLSNTKDRWNGKSAGSIIFFSKYDLRSAYHQVPEKLKIKISQHSKLMEDYTSLCAFHLALQMQWGLFSE